MSNVIPFNGITKLDLNPDMVLENKCPPAALEAPTQKPVAWMEMVVANLVRQGIGKHKARELAEHFYTTQPTAQRPFVGLTNEDVKDLCNEASSFGTSSWIRHIEAKLKEKNI